MGSLISSAERYLESSFGWSISVTPWNGQKELPIYLSNSYNLFLVEIFQQPCLLAACMQRDISATTIQNHMAKIANISGLPCICVSSELSSYTQQSLLRQRVSFIIPNKQIYLPEFAYRLQDNRISRPQLPPSEHFSPATQLVLIGALLGKYPSPLKANDLWQTLPYSKMTMSRVIEELEHAGVLEIKVSGRTKWAYLKEEKRELWHAVELKLRNPVLKTFRCSYRGGVTVDNGTDIWFHVSASEFPKVTYAGESALAKYSNLNAPKIPTFAVSSSQWSNIKHEFLIVDMQDDNFPLMQVWSYDPAPLSTHGIADPLSLYLSLDQNSMHDSRLSHARSELLERYL